MGKTYSCPYEGCDMVFKKQFELKKHKVTHDRSAPLFYCTECIFYTLDSRNLKVHFARHTGELIFPCPHTVSVRGASGLLAEEPCNYHTSDRSALTKHRKTHGYIPRPRASPQRGAAFTFIPYLGPPSSATKKATSRVKKSKRVKKSSRTRVAKQGSTRDAEHAALDSSSPSTSQQGVNTQEHRVESPDAAGSSSVSSSSAMSLTPNEYTLVDVHEQRTYVESPDATGTLAASSGDTIQAVPNEGIFLPTYWQSVDMESSHAAGSSSTMPVAPNQGISMDVPFGVATDFDQWSQLFPEDYTAPSMTEAQNPVPNFQMDPFATGIFGTNIGHYGAGIEGWSEADWNNFYARFDSV